MVEAIHQFGANIIACQMAMGERQLYIVGCYLALGYGVKIWGVEMAMKEWPRGTDLIVAGDLNVYLEKAGGQGRDKEIAAMVTTAGLEDILGCFLPQRHTWCRDRRTWAIVRQERVVRFRTDYILGYDRQILRNVSIQYQRHKYDHYMVMGCLLGTSPREHL